MAINDKSQGSVATYIRCVGYVLLQSFRIFADERIFIIGKYLVKLQPSRQLLDSHALDGEIDDYTKWGRRVKPNTEVN